MQWSKLPLAGGARVRRGAKRRGNILMLSAFLMIVVMAFVALAVDTGYMYGAKAQLQRQVDAAALAGAGALIDGSTAAQDKAVEYLVRNPVGGGSIPADNEAFQLALAEFKARHEHDYELKLGHWNVEDRTFSESVSSPSTVSVKMRYNSLPLFFARAMGNDTFAIEAQSIARYQPRDIVLVLDYSASMNDDSELGSVGLLNRTLVENNLLQIYQELGSPTYGNKLTFAPAYPVVHGQAQSGSIPHVTVEFRETQVYVTSTSSINQVRLQFSNNNTQTLSGSGTTGTFKGSGSNNNKSITKVWVKSGSNSNSSNPYGEYFNFTSSNLKSIIKTALGISTVAYPYPSGSWDGFIDYCRSSGTGNNTAGYRYKFGYMNLISYWLEEKPAYAETPSLWQVSAQPIGAVKDATEVFMDYIGEVDAGDRVSLVIYNGPSGDATTEHMLTYDLETISDTVSHRQAGHYHSYTNIGAGLQWARQELEQHARQGAFKMIVLMTDGNANWVNGSYNTSAANQYVLNEAAAVANHGWPIVTLCLGAGADTSIMSSVATTTGGENFVVPGGQSASDYREDLIEVFRRIADKRPLQLVQ